MVILNQNIPTALAYNAIAQGKLLYEVEPFKLMIEPKVLNEYFDYKLSLQKNNLTLVK